MFCEPLLLYPGNGDQTLGRFGIAKTNILKFITRFVVESRTFLVGYVRKTLKPPFQFFKNLHSSQIHEASRFLLKNDATIATFFGQPVLQT